MNFKFCIIVGLIYTVTEKWTFVEAPPPQKPTYYVCSFSLQQKTNEVKEFKHYYPVLDKYWMSLGDHPDVMGSALGCAKLAVLYPFLSSFRLLLLGLGFGVSAGMMKTFTCTDGTPERAPMEYFQKIHEFNDLAREVAKSRDALDVDRMFAATNSQLSDIFTKFVSGAGSVGKMAVNEMGNSLKSCLAIFGLFTNNKKPVGDFLDAVRNSVPTRLPETETDPSFSNPGGLMGEIGDWLFHPPIGSYEAKFKQIDRVCRGAGADGSGRSRTNRSSERSAGFFNFFDGGGDGGNDPFKDCVKTSLRDDDDYDD